MPLVGQQEGGFFVFEEGKNVWVLGEKDEPLYRLVVKRTNEHMKVLRRSSSSSSI